MKSKLVLWGSNAQDEKCLIAVSLRAADNKVDIWTFDEAVATDEFCQQLTKEWRDGDGMELPEPKTHQERDLTLSGSLLPDDLKVERGDVVQRAQAEWHFIVLSTKLNESYEAKLDALRERISKLEDFDQPTWDSLKDFWNKVQEQVRDRNLFREQGERLRSSANELFAQMKEMRKHLDQEFDRISKEAHDKFFEGLAEVERKMESGARLNVLFDELKRLQSMFRESKVLSREHRNKVWEKLDGTFKAVKEKRFGDKPGGVADNSSQLQRLQHRYDGLLKVIDRMEYSLRRDHRDLEFEQHKIDTTAGQLEAQIRQAKLRMIEERVTSKEAKLKEMLVTKADIEKRLAILQEKEAKRASKTADKTTAAEGEEHTAASENAAPAEEPVASEPPKQDESIFGAVSAIMGESLDGVVDTVKAVASVIGEKIGDAIEELREEVHEATAPNAEAPAAEEPAAPAAEEAVAPAAKPKRAPAARKAKAAKEEVAPAEEES